jgi:hypothetical protein
VPPNESGHFTIGFCCTFDYISCRSKISMILSMPINQTSPISAKTNITVHTAQLGMTEISHLNFQSFTTLNNRLNSAHNTIRPHSYCNNIVSMHLVTTCSDISTLQRFAKNCYYLLTKLSR